MDGKLEETDLEKGISQLFEKFKKLKPSQKVECIAATVLSLFLLIIIPAYAWFASINKMETLTKVKTPPALDIRAGRHEAIKNFELKNVDIGEAAANGKCYVFCVKSGNIESKYKIQLAHTTNIPLKYKLYRAVEVSSTDSPDVDYQLENSDEHAYYKKSGSEIVMTELNAENDTKKEEHGRRLAIFDKNDDYYKLAYNTADGTPEIYAVAKYSQSDSIQTLSAEYDFFILELGWDGTEPDVTHFSKWNKKENNKETDIIYISASKVRE